MKEDQINHISNPDIQQKMKIDFYKLHYPQYKSPKNRNHSKNKMRSKSVVNVFDSHSASEQLPSN